MNDIGHHLTHVLTRIETALARPRTCDECGCLCRRGESCPNCALTNATRDPS